MLIPRVLTCVALASAFSLTADAQRVLFLSKSSSFEHSVVKSRVDGGNLVADILGGLAEAYDGVELTATKDAGLINAENLKNYDLVIFYTCGDLTESGGDKSKGIFAGDGNPPMGKDGVIDLIEWIEDGGAFMGFHSASVTFQSSDDRPSDYIELLGGEFEIHGEQFTGTVRTVDEDHPVMAGFPKEWKIMDEWYLFKNLNKERIHVLAVLDAGEEREKQKMYDTPNYPVIWCSAVGKGRVYYNAMGHREDVWMNEQFQRAVVIAAGWALDEGDADAEPNYAEVIKE